MVVEEITKRYTSLPEIGALQKVLADTSTKKISLQGLQGSAAPVLFAALQQVLGRPMLFVLDDADEAGYFYHDLTQLLGARAVLFFPSSYRRSVKYGQKDAANEILRTEVLARLNGKSHTYIYIVTYPEALAELVVSPQHLDQDMLQLHTRQTVSMASTTQRLRELRFQEVDYVYEPGQFAVRGSIIDVYAYSHKHPFRIDFFGDQIDTIRTFDIQDQLSKEQKDSIEIVGELNANSHNSISFTNFLPSETIMVAKDLEFVHETITKTYQRGFSEQAILEQTENKTEAERQAVIREMQASNKLIGGVQFHKDTEKFQKILLNRPKEDAAQAAITFNTSPQPLFHKNFTLLKETLNNYLEQGYHLFIWAESKKQIQRLHNILNEENEENGDEPKIQFQAVETSLHEGFIDKQLRICCFTDHQIFDRFHKYNLQSDTARQGKLALTMKELQELAVGDYVVHIDFGVGKFAGLVRIPVGNSYQEAIRLVYQRGDKVDVSIHSLYKISKYRSNNGNEAPRLSTLGTGAWERMKERTKKRIKDIARDLIKLYAKRRHEKGFAYSADTYLQHALEASFLYEDTPDQLRATQEVKADMERPRPMDRLVCGDVGFGKTEIAVRAAFKAACDSKQVAVLVPTTVLAFQHFQTFTERLKDLPVSVDYLSRSKTAKQTAQTLEKLKNGNIDIIVGTHKLIGKQVRWKDLGLLIIDEEQKFGVAVKEKLRTLKSNVDTLTMSATPIPRTLQFSLMGARDMSILRTPPPNRHPIYTEHMTSCREQMTDAINFEMSRNGQVFFINNRISSLQETANTIKKHIPDCRIAIGHGQMKPEELEKIILGFINHDYDVLLSTTIIENGIDIPNANTIIINDAHKFGLSDLHQMRGRVGRSNKKAFCYLIAPPKSLLTPEARRRLEALENLSELGSGFNLAMQDLDIRGAGNLLGAEQSGFMEDLGYETYQKILNQAVTELKNDEFYELYGTNDTHELRNIEAQDFVDDCTIESDMEMFFPESYVPGSSERMLLYRELENIQDDAELDAYRKRLTDRFGQIPKEGEELLHIVALRRLGRQTGCEKITLRQGRMQLQFVSNINSPYYQSETFGKIIQHTAQNVRRCTLKEVNGKRLMVINDIKTALDALEELQSIGNLQNH